MLDSLSLSQVEGNSRQAVLNRAWEKDNVGNVKIVPPTFFNASFLISVPQQDAITSHLVSLALMKEFLCEGNCSVHISVGRQALETPTVLSC